MTIVTINFLSLVTIFSSLFLLSFHLRQSITSQISWGPPNCESKPRSCQERSFQVQVDTVDWYQKTAGTSGVGQGRSREEMGHLWMLIWDLMTAN